MSCARELGNLALRLHRHGYHSDDELRSELQWMQALSGSGVRVPNVIPAKSGDLFIRHSGDGLPGELQIDLFEWIEGEQLGSVEEGVADPDEVAATYNAIGELAARVHNQATTCELPKGFTRHAWDADHASAPATTSTGNTRDSTAAW